MEEKKEIKISLKMAVLLFIILLIIAGIIAFFILHNNKDNQNNNTTNTNNANDDNSTSKISKDYKEISINSKTYYQRLNKKTWNGKYHQEEFFTADRIDSVMEVVSYTKYLKIIDSINSISSSKIKPYYSDKESNYIVLSYANGFSWCKMDLIDCLEDNKEIIIYGDEEVDGSMADGSGYFIAIPTNMPVGTDIEYKECYTNSQIDNIKKYGVPYDVSEMMLDKPILYLYPTEITEISVKLGYPEKITCSYPKYTTGWNVLANPNGDLIDLDTKRKLYSLYYESRNVVDLDVKEYGFIVEGTDVDKFLEEKLEILGLTEREAEEFIVYWLPKLQENKYNYIRFATIEEINSNMPLEFSVEPDTLIRVLMIYKGLDEPIEIQEQKLETPKRDGFVVVEWGGTEIN